MICFHKLIQIVSLVQISFDDLSGDGPPPLSPLPIKVVTGLSLSQEGEEEKGFKVPPNEVS